MFYTTKSSGGGGGGGRTVLAGSKVFEEKTSRVRHFARRV